MPPSTAVLNVVAQVVGTRDVIDDPDLQLYEHELLDSLRTVELIIALSDTFHIQISPAAIDRDAWATPRRIAAFVESRWAPPEGAK
jgi:D-alanine--poly(phosphoribitol) ligase subunit 2